MRRTEEGMVLHTRREAAAHGPDTVRATGAADRIYYPGVNTCLTVTFLFYEYSWFQRNVMCCFGYDSDVGHMIGGHANMFFNGGINAAASAVDLLTGPGGITRPNGNMMTLAALENRRLRAVVFAGALSLGADYGLAGLRARIRGVATVDEFSEIDTTPHGTAYIVFDHPTQAIYVRGGDGHQLADVLHHPTNTLAFGNLP